MCDDESSDESGNSAPPALALAQPTLAAVATAAAATSSISEPKQGFAVDNSVLKEEFDEDGEAVSAAAAVSASASAVEIGKDWGGGPAAASGGCGGSGSEVSGKRVQSYPLLPDDKVVPSSSPSPSAVAAAITVTTVTTAAADRKEAAAAAEVSSSCLTSSSSNPDGSGSSSVRQQQQQQQTGGKGGIPGDLLAAYNKAAGVKAATAERRGFVGDEQKRDRFDEFVTGFLSMSLFQAADVWLPLGSSSLSGNGSGGGGDGQHKKVSRLFLFSSKVQDPALAKWSSLSRNVVLASGVGLPGIVFQERRPQWAVSRA